MRTTDVKSVVHRLVDSFVLNSPRSWHVCGSKSDYKFNRRWIREGYTRKQV